MADAGAQAPARKKSLTFEDADEISLGEISPAAPRRKSQPPPVLSPAQSNKWRESAVTSKTYSLQRTSTRGTEYYGFDDPEGDANARTSSERRQSSRANLLFKGHVSDDSNLSHVDESLKELSTIRGLGLIMSQPPPDDSDTRRGMPSRLATFGELHFEAGKAENTPYGRGAKFACVGAARTDQDANNLFRLLDEGWQLKRPTVLLSVTGSARNLSLEPRLEQRLCVGLQRVASCSGGWVISGGTDSGVMALVGRALRERLLDGRQFGEEGRQLERAPVIGIAPWGAVHMREKLYSKKLQAKLKGLEQFQEVCRSRMHHTRVPVGPPPLTECMPLAHAPHARACTGDSLVGPPPPLMELSRSLSPRPRTGPTNGRGQPPAAARQGAVPCRHRKGYGRPGGRQD